MPTNIIINSLIRTIALYAKAVSAYGEISAYVINSFNSIFFRIGSTMYNIAKPKLFGLLKMC